MKLKDIQAFKSMTNEMVDEQLKVKAVVNTLEKLSMYEGLTGEQCEQLEEYKIREDCWNSFINYLDSFGEEKIK